MSCRLQDAVVRGFELGRYKLRVDLLAAADGKCYWEEFLNFTIGDAASGYKLTYTTYTGTAGVGMLYYSNGMMFTTYDADHDLMGAGVNCAADPDIGANGGGGWYKDCGGMHVNGYNGPNTIGWAGFAWHQLPPGSKLLQSRLTLVLQ